MKNFPKALFYYNRAIDLNSTNPEIYNAIALLYADFEEYIEALAYRKAQGVKLGRPRGLPSSPVKQVLFDNRHYIKEALSQGVSRANIARHLHVGSTSLYEFLREHPELI